MAKRKPVRRPAPNVRAGGRTNEKVMLGVTYGHFEPAFVQSLVFTVVYDAHHYGRIVNGGSYLQFGTTNIAQGRNEIVRRFLERDEDWLWFIDTDQGWEPDTLERMVASAHPVERPILGALAFSYSRGDAQEQKPTLWGITPEGKFGRHLQVPETPGVYPFASTGTGCVLIHRRVLEGVRDFTPKGADRPFGATAQPWFEYAKWINDEGAPDILGEDLTFFLRAAAAGFVTHVDTSIGVDHWKKFAVNLDTYSRQAIRVRPPCVAVIPVKGKHHLTRALVDQLLEQGDVAYIAIMDNGSDSDPYVDERVDVIECAGLNIHEMWNRGVDDALGQFDVCDVAILNNDLEIGPDFLAGLSHELRSDERRLAVSPNYDGRPVSGFQQVHGICANRYDGTGGLAGFAFMVKGETFREGSPLRFDENLQWWFGDNLFCLAMEQVGGVYGIATRTSVKHLDGGSQTAKDADLDAAIDKDRAYFEARLAEVS